MKIGEFNLGVRVKRKGAQRGSYFHECKNSSVFICVHLWTKNHPQNKPPHQQTHLCSSVFICGQKTIHKINHPTNRLICVHLCSSVDKKTIHKINHPTNRLICVHLCSSVDKKPLKTFLTSRRNKINSPRN
jgi:hypothetical protein